MEGSFTNITCIDEVHVNINSKVNKLMRDFNANIGKNACLNGSDIGVELLSGNISFKGNEATIFIQFSLRFRSSQQESVEQCGAEFQAMVLRLLPARMGQVTGQVSPQFCQQANYTPGATNVSRTAWDCPKGYALDTVIFVCQRTITTPVTTSASITPTPTASTPPLPVRSIPRMTLTFQATMTPLVHKGRKDLEACLAEYDRGLTRLLSDLEPPLQNYNGSCSNIFVDITTNLSVAIHDTNRLTVLADVRLLPLADSIHHSSLTRCGTVLTSMFDNPGKHLPNVTLPAGYVLNCSSLQLNPPCLISVADPSFYCDDGFFYEEYNFLCLNESLPSFTVEIHLTVVLDKAPKKNCHKALESSATNLSQVVMEDVHSQLMSGALCNASTLSVVDTEVIISIPLLLLGLGGRSEPVNECKTHLYSHLSASLGNPVNAMMGVLNASCNVASWPRTFSQAAEKWGCFEGRVYSAQTHSCDHFGALEESITKTKGLMSERRRRDTHQGNDIRPFWNTTLPVCQDHEPPAFNGCPRTSVGVPLGPEGPVPATIDVPSVSDNSGGALVVTYQPPDFRPRRPYIFRQNTIVNITAVDTAGNKAVCRISVFLTDTTPPSIHCCEKLHRHHYNTSYNNRVDIVYPDGLITASDYGGVASIAFDPVPGTSVMVMKKINVTATAVDWSGNAASCSFFYLATNDRCPLWELPVPALGQGQRTCTSEIQGSVGFGVSCQVACPQGSRFVSLPPTQYICVNGSVWHPQNHVPPCGNLSYTNFDFNMTLNFTYDGVSSNNYCLELVSKGVLSQIEPFFDVVCVQSASFVDIKIEHMGFFDPQGRHFFVLKMKVSISLRPGIRASKGWALKCGTLILAQVDNLTSRIPVLNCGNVSFLPPSDSQGQMSCSSGSVLVGDYCLECPAGTYHNSSTKRCDECPQGQFQSSQGQGTCDRCPEGSSTDGTGATTPFLCLDLCPAGSNSSTGLWPCERCERGWYQAERGKKWCESCPDGQSTVSVGTASPRDCLELCPVGQHSATGMVPCSPCPLHHYSSQPGTTLCVECAPYRVTHATASTSSGSCVVVDWCQSHTCAAGSTCVNQHRFAQCLCAPGFTGERCEKNVDECASQPCVNGATCEDGVNSFTCHCTPGYEGQSCEQETDECSPDPCVHGQCLDTHLNYTCQCSRCETNIDDCVNNRCQNGGQCVDLVDDFRCDCSGTGYEGAACQNDIDDCSNSSCLNSGTCRDRVNGFDCTCSPGFTGAMCEINIDECQTYPCLNNALCIDQINSYRCICQPGYIGNDCEMDINECASSPCVNGGTCTNLVSDYLCTCQRGYEGKNCQVNTDDCASSPCHLAGIERCEDGVDSFTCHCLPLWEGKLCDTPADPCARSPCVGGATCTVAGDTFVCLCPPDFTGRLCDHRINDCQSGPCMNNGTCQDGVRGFRCGCLPGLTGALCDLNVDECSSQPCVQGATCLDLIDGFTCSQPCAKGATCLDLIDGFTCRCALGYGGELCEENIDDCASQPCAHGGTCRDLVDHFRCYCPPGYTGKTCSDDVNECDNSPCQNGATCVNLQGHFRCQCPPGYRGDLCQGDLCHTNNSCLNNATCVVQSGGVTCRCSPQFTAVDCGKEKSGDYDLLFPGKTASACRPPEVLVPASAQLALCLWLRYASPKASGTVFTLTRSDANRGGLPMDDAILLELAGRVVSVSLEGEREPRRFTVAVTDGKWHHVCYQWFGSRHAAYVDGSKTSEEKYGAEVTLSDRLKLVLGHPHALSTTTTHFFQGEISQANLFSTALDESQIKSMALNCSDPQLPGDMFAWPQADTYLEGGVTVVTPMICGRSKCAPGFHGTYCSVQTDKTAPRVMRCPRDQSVTKNSAMVMVTWEEPVFEDNVAIVRIQQTHRSGQAFHQGEYLVTYVAYDAENNSAECSFTVIVKPFDCVEPAAPKHGAKVCQTWLHGSFCTLQCLPSYFHEELPPTFYVCGQLGSWDPPLRDPGHFPACSSTTGAEVSMVGVVGVQGPGCTDEFRVRLKARFTDIMTQLDSVLGLCQQRVCDFENGLSVTCDKGGSSSGRRRRAVGSLYRVAIHVDVPSNSSAVQKSNAQWAAEEIMTAMKRGRFDDSQFTADPAASHLSVDFICEPGQVLRRIQEAGNSTRVCVDCPEGSYHNSTASDCRLCEPGSYSSQSRQLQCRTCPPQTTTAAPGAARPDACFDLCSSGSYYDPESSSCQRCPRGQYQPGTGRTSCLYCPVGQSTKQPGATNSQLCANVCDLGQEIREDGRCQPCPRGSYQHSRDTPVCQPCPYGRTTARVGATALKDCSVVVCQLGHRWLPDNRCEPCPVGTYQPARGSNLCIPCGAGLTTSDPGSDSKARCHRGPVDECKLATHQCDEQATCVDTENDYYCVCRSGFTGNGINCTDLCADHCENDGVCDYGVDGRPFCNCKNGFTGDRCQEEDLVSAGLSSAVAGGIAGSVVGVIVIIIITVACYWRHRIQQKKSHDRVYRSRKGMAPAAFYNEGYESVRDSISTPSQLIVREQSSSTSSSSTLSMAPRWNRSTFANSDEDEMDACWFESFHMDDLSLGSDAFTRTARLEVDSYL
ncbi:hypothetical protein ACOMHN_003420 [Nucella lapillus]